MFGDTIKKHVGEFFMLITKQNSKRLILLGITFTSFILVLILRLFYIQVIQHNFYISEVNKQRQINLPINSGRGMIYDRNFIPLIDRKEKNMAIIFPQLFNISYDNLQYLSQLTGRNEKDLAKQISNSYYPIEISIDKEINWQDKRNLTTRGLFIVNKKQRYEDYPILSHAIGYINQVDNKGMSGVEKAFDSILMGHPTEILTITLDGRKQPLPGEKYSVVNSPIRKKDIRLTIDYHFQNIVENVMDKHKYDGAIIISSVETGEILALVSRPNYNPNSIVNHIKSDGDELYNKAIQMAFPPGSIFKIVLAAEAIEKKIIKLDDVFYCNGYEAIENVKIKCSAHKNANNIKITFKEAFAQSCNSAFIQLGQMLDVNNIIDMARRLNLCSKVDIGLIEEEVGGLPMGDSLLGPAIANISIGQGDIEVTPIQVNQLTQIIANGGVKVQLHLLKDIVENYNTVEIPESRKQTRVLSYQTSTILQELMGAVMEGGTGNKIGELSNITAGKTGTAESSIHGQTIQHAWFTGYYPKNNPQYAITVFLQGGGSGGAVAVPAFKNIIEGIVNLDQ